MGGSGLSWHCPGWMRDCTHIVCILTGMVVVGKEGVDGKGMQVTLVMNEQYADSLCTVSGPYANCSYNAQKLIRDDVLMPPLIFCHT